MELENAEYEEESSKSTIEGKENNAEKELQKEEEKKVLEVENEILETIIRNYTEDDNDN